MKKFLAAALALCMMLPAAPVHAADPKAATTEAETSVSHAVADYTGDGTVIAVVAAGFTAEHPVFAEDPPVGALTATDVDHVLPGAYYSQKLPAVWDFADNDADVSSVSIIGTAVASLAAGRFTGAGDTKNEDGTVTHESSFAGAAPDAQLLLFKAAPDSAASQLDSTAAAAAIRAAVHLSADVIVLETSSLTWSETLAEAITLAHESGIPILTGAGDRTLAYSDEDLPVTVTDRGTLTDWASVAGITVIGAAADPYDGVSEFLLRQAEAEDESISYTDTCSDYFGEPFAALMDGQELPLIAVPGYGAAEDYENIDVTGAVAVIARGEISFSEKASFAAEAGAVAMIVIDDGSGVSRMSLDTAPIPGVMISAEDGARVTETLERGEAFMAFSPVQAGAASFSANGITDDLSATVAFLCAGQRVTAAIPTSTTLNAQYARVSGTLYAAAAAAGYVARAVQFCRAAEIPADNALSLAASSAQTLHSENGNPLSPRTAGYGIVSARGSYATTVICNEENTAVSVDSSTIGITYLNLRLTNTTDEKKTYRLTLRLFGEEYSESEDGTDARLTGENIALSGARAYIGDSSHNLAAKDAYATVIVEAGETIDFTMRVSIPEALLRQMNATFWNGFFVDGAVVLTADTEEITHPFSFFYGNWESASLADATVYDEYDPILAASYLAVRTFDKTENENGLVLPLGAITPYRADSAYDETYNLINPASLRYGWVELSLVALRDIDSVEIHFFDEQRHEIFTKTVHGVEKSLSGGHTVIPLWNFIAEDNEEYLFPDGTYTCEICLKSSFGQYRDAVQFMGFSITVDTISPRVSGFSLYRAGETILLDVTATDNTALMTISAYDSAFTFPESEEGTSLTDQTAATCTFDVTQYDGRSPLYMEVTDRSGNYAVIRLSADQFNELLAAYDEAHADAANEENEETEENDEDAESDEEIAA